MHNRKKLDRPPTDAEQAMVKSKCETYSALINMVFKKKKLSEYNLESLNLAGKMLKVNPDIYSLWNYRREILCFMNPVLEDVTKSKLVSAPQLDEIKKQELALTADAIKRNPKSYGAWHHRAWVLDHFQVDIESELILCALLLKADQRNFHCWNYRRYVVSCGNVSPQQEFSFTTTKIQENFSNYSAFHHRSIFIKLQKSNLQELIITEFALIENAIFTEPDDQSAWWYHQFLLKWALEHINKEKSEDTIDWFEVVIKQQLNMMRSLLEIEGNCRWVMLCIISLLEVQLSPVFVSRVDSSLLESMNKERRKLLRKLINVDPAHGNRYSYLLSKLDE